jgi:D-beta-D-heptose 7-phosphate kinase/D-beta-D-heptose 1-phosphate adenosyltransferase
MFSIGRGSGPEKRHLAIVSQSELILQRSEWKRNGKRVVCAAGAFDLLHPGHIRLLEQARGLGDILLVALQSDASVRSNVQADAQHAGLRPITPAAERAEILAALAAVDHVVEFDEATPREFFARMAPDVVVQGGEAGSQQSGSLDDDAVRAAGGRVVRVALEPGYSTSLLLERISQLHA